MDSATFESVSGDCERKQSLRSTAGVHALTVLARVINDPKFDLHNAGINRRVLGAAHAHVERHFGAAIRQYVEEWTIDATDQRNVERKIEELAWVNTVIYAMRGFRPGQRFHGDFFFMHSVTSSLFLSSVVSCLTPRSQEVLLRAYFGVCLTFFVARGCRQIDIRRFYAETDPYPRPPITSLPYPSSDALTGASADAALPNAWASLLQNGMVHPDEHFPKIQRTLAHFSSIYGSRPAGLRDLAETELEGAEILDGSLFIRAAGLTADSMGRVLDGEPNSVRWHGRNVSMVSDSYGRADH
ncbi:hypothetical protein HGRIS_014381 [Hohenbuehelia grisea]|uniref:Uncharacterized protein n=1 Tax=Hohenbuehelia grisea TaxID=104357 RepID=A0ABR3JVD6_9AGAR